MKVNLFLSYLIIFIVGSFLGWIIDTGYRTIISRKYETATIIPYFATLYGIGGVILTAIFQFVNTNLGTKIAIGAVAIILVEFFGGIFILKIFKRRLWDYSRNRFNVKGHVDLLHSFYWVLLTIAFSFVFPIIYSLGLS